MRNTFHNWRYWIPSLSIPLVLIACRMLITHSLTYGFYYWNLLLALVPLAASTLLDPKASLLSRRNLSCLAAWFFFLPNAPYLITDMIHFQERPPFPVYVDEIIVYACAWNGVLLAYASIMRVERWLLIRYAQRPVNIALVAIFLLTGLGIYLGRFLRWNTWDMLVHPYALGKDIGIRMLYPVRYKQTWAVSLLFGGLLMAGYMLLRNQIQGRNTILDFRRRTLP
jgi:uncharacterized membrane protein